MLCFGNMLVDRFAIYRQKLLEPFATLTCASAAMAGPATAASAENCIVRKLSQFVDFFDCRKAAGARYTFRL